MSDILKFSTIKSNKIVFTELKDLDFVPSQKIGFVRYDNNGNEIQLKIQSPELYIETGGIPRESQYYPTPKERSFFKYSFCHKEKRYPSNANYEQIEQFFDKLIEIDNMCNTDEFRKQVFGEKNYNQYSYQPLVRFPEVDEEEPKLDKNGKPILQFPYIKIKLELEREEDQDDPKNIPKFSIFEKIDGKRAQVQLKSFDDVVKVITWQSKVRFIISFSKLYAMKTKAGKDKKGYGITLKATSIEVQRSANAIKTQTNNDAFLDSDEEENVKPSAITRNNNLDNNVEDEEEVVNEVVDDEEVIEEPKSKGKKKNGKVNNK